MTSTNNKEGATVEFAANHGTVSAGDPRTASSGTEVLRAGGNAVDAAVGANLTAFVTEPILTSPFGGGLALVAGADTPPQYLQFFAHTPGLGLSQEQRAGIEFQGLDVHFGPAVQQFHVGRGSTAVPLMLRGLMQLHGTYGRLPLEQVCAPALRHARAGVTLSDGVGPILQILDPIIRLRPETESLFAPDGTMLGPGSTFRSPGLVTLLEHFSCGDLTAADNALLSSFGPPHGLVTQEDLDCAQVRKQPPIHISSRGFDIYLPPPPTSGGLLVAFGLKILEQTPDAIWENPTSAQLHLLAAMSATQSARVRTLDPALHDPNSDLEDLVHRFLDDSSIEHWRMELNTLVQNGPQAPSSEVPTLGSTTHISVVDDTGLACSITSSNGEGSGHLVPGLGAMANNFMGEADLHPNGFHLSPAGTALTSMMCPMVVCQNGRPILSIGTGGSNRIRTALLQVLTRHLYGQMDIQNAVSAPRIHFEGETLYLESRGPASVMPEETLKTLLARCPDHTVFEEPNMFFGGVHAAATGGEGAGDPRRGGSVATT